MTRKQSKYLAPVKMSPRVQFGVTSSIRRTKSSVSSTYLEKRVLGMRIPLDLKSWKDWDWKRIRDEETNAQQQEGNNCSKVDKIGKSNILVCNLVMKENKSRMSLLKVKINNKNKKSQWTKTMIKGKFNKKALTFAFWKIGRAIWLDVANRARRWTISPDFFPSYSKFKRTNCSETTVSVSGRSLNPEIFKKNQ